MDRRRAGALLALAACIACSAAAPTASDHTALDLYDGSPEGCYYNFQHYREGDRIMTNEPCLNCTCHNRMLMCYLRVCPFTKAIGQDCTIEKRADQCCPIVTCPDVPVDLLTSTSTTSPAEYGATGLGKLDKYGCSINGKYFPEGSKVPPTPNKPCEHCYCIRNMTTCVMQECTLHVDGCTPIYHKDVCCPVRYSCDHQDDEMLLLDDMSTTVRPTPGFLLTTTTETPVTQITQDCVHDDHVFADGALIKTEKACEHCYCMKGDIVCVVQECGTPMENEGKNCTSLPPREGQCCPDTYICEGDELTTDLPTDLTTESILDTPTTILPPRRSSVEGSGYRNEPDEVPATKTPAIQSEHEGSGDDQTIMPLDTTEKIGSEKPVDTDKFTTATEGSLDILQTTIQPSFGEPVDSQETTRDEYSSGITEPQDYAPTTISIPVERDDEGTEIQKELTTKLSYESDELITTTLAAERYDSITTQPEEAFNTVPDSIYEEEGYKPHKHIPSKTHAPSLEELTTSSVIEKDVSDITSEKADRNVVTVPSSTAYADDTTQSTKEHDTTFIESATQKDSYEHDQYTPSTTSDTDIGENNTYPDVGKDKDGTELTTNAPSTVNIPTVKEEEEGTTELDHDKNTVVVVDDDIIHHNIHSTTAKTTLTDAESTTLYNLELGSGAEEVTEEGYNPTLPSDNESTEAGVDEQDKEITSSEDKVNESSSEASILERTTISEYPSATESDETRRTESKPTILSESSTLTSESTVTARGDHFTITTEPSFRKEDESSVSTEKPKDLDATTLKNDFTDEEFIPTSSQDEKLSSGPIVPSIEQEFTTTVPDDISESTESTTEPILVSSVSSETIPGKLPELPTKDVNEFLFGTPTTEKISEMTTSTAEYVAQHHVESGRIPGEGDCLLNGVTYRNNSVVPSTNNCHSGCKCASSIIKCDPIICSPPPDYMHNCQSVYDSPDACCPTYVCDHPRETVPPQSDNQMFGTESPLPSPAIECRGDQCEIGVDTKQPVSGDKADSNKCGSERCDDVPQKPDVSNYPHKYPEQCKDGKCDTPTKDCANGKCEELPSKDLICDSIHGCQAVPVKPCEGEHCKTTSTEVTAHLPQTCENKEDCKNLQVTPCEGDSCKFEVPSAEAPQNKPCIEEDGCKPTQSTAQKCEGDSCKNIEIPSIDHKLPSKCEGSDCVTQTEKISVEGIFDSTTESFTQKQTPTEIYKEQLQPNAKVPESTESQKDIVYVAEQQTNNYEQKESFTTSPDFTVSNELVTESEASEEPNEVGTTVQEGKGTTVSENFAVDTEKSPTDTPATEINNIEISRTETTELESQTPAYHKYTTQTIDQDKLPESHSTEQQYITTDTGKDNIKDSSMNSEEPTIQPVVKDESLTSSEPQITISEIVSYEQTTASYGTEPSIAPKPQDTTMISPQAQDFETQTTQSSAVLELSTDGVLSSVTLHPKEEIYTPLTEKENEINTQKPERPSVTSADLEITTHQMDISSFVEQMATMKTDTEESTIGAVEIVSKSTETTTEGQYGYTQPPEYELTGTKPNKIGPVIIEPQEGTNTELPKPSLIEETTTQISDNSDYITETDEIATELPVRVSHVPELYTIIPSSEQYITEKLHIVDEMQTKSPTEYSKQPEQFTTEAPVRFPEEETDTEINTIIKEDMTEIPALFTAEPEKGLTEIEEVLSTGQDETTSKKSIPSESEATISSEQTDKSIEHYEPSTTERLHDIIEITVPNSEKPLYFESQSQLIGVTKPQEADKKITEEDTTEKQEEITKAVLTEDTSSISIKEEMGTEVPVTELGVPEKSPQPEKSEGEENALTTSELPEFGTKSPIPENNAQEDETSGIEKIPEPHGTVLDLTTESSEPAKQVTNQEENNTDIPIMQEVQVNLDTIAPEVVTEQFTSTEIPQKELSKVPNLYGTDEYETEAHSTTTKNELQETGSSRTTTDAPVSPDIMKEDTEGLTEPHDSNMEDQTVLNIQKQSTESYTETEEIRTEPPISHDITNVESGFTPTAHTTESLDIGTNGPDMYGTGQEKTETESPVQQLQTTESVEKITGETIETGFTKSEESITKYPEDTVSEKEPSGQEEYVTKTPELESSLIPNGTQESTQAVNGQDIKEIENTNVQDEKTTKAPEGLEVSELDVSRQAEEITKAPEQENKETQSTKVSIPEVISQQEDITKAPEVIKESELPVTGYEEESTKATTDIKETEAEVTSPGENVTGTPQSISQDDKTTETSVYLENLPEIIDHEEDTHKGTMESLPEHTIQEEEVTSVPEVIIESLSENTALEDKVTKAPEVIKESLPEVIKHEEDIISTTEDMKVSLPEVSNQEKEVIKAPEETKEESFSDVTEQDSEFSKDTTEKEGSLPELIGQEDQVTKSPEATTEFLLHLTEQDEGATKVSEDKKESLPEFTDKEEKVTKAPEDPKETLVEKQEENITKTPEVTEEFLPELEKDEKVTLAPEDKTELPEIIEKEAEQTKFPEYIKDEVVTKPPEDTKEFMPELTTQDERVTKAPEETKVVLPEVTEQEMEVTNIPEDKKDSLPDISEQEEEVTKSSVDINEILSETTRHGEDITKSPEVTKETLSDITEKEQPVTQFPDEKVESAEDKLHEYTKESLPEITDLKDKVTITPEESNELLPGTTEQGEEVTKMPEDSRETLPEVTEKDEQITKTPEENLEPLPEITSTQTPEVINDTTTPQVTKQEEGFTKSPEDKTESLPDITRPVDEVTKTPADTIESLPEGTKQDEGVTKSPEDSKESLTESTELKKEVTKIPDGMIESLTEDTRPKEDDKESLPEITEQLEETTKSPDDTNVSLSEITAQEEEVTKTPYDTKEPEPEVTREEEKITSVPEYTAEKESRPEVTSQDETVTKTPQNEKETTFEAVTEQQENTLITHGVHTATDTIIPFYSESDNNLLEYSTPKQVEYTSTEQSKDQFSETTPDVIILEEHTHKIIETTPTARPLDEQLTTVAYDTEVSEEVSEVTSTKPSGEHIETVTMQSEITTGSTQTSLHSFDQVTEKDILPESTEETLSVHKHDEVSKDKEPTLVSTLEETTAAVFVDAEKTTVTNTVLPIQTEKIPSSSEQSVYPEIPETQTVLVDELLTATTKATTTKQEEDLVTPANIDTPMKPETTVVADDLLTTTAKVTTAKQDEELVKKPMTPEEQPVESSEVTPSTTIPESPKPIAEETHPTDELPTPEEDSNFPSSGISGYGEPDYVEEDQAFSPGTCRYGGKVYVSAQQIPRDDPCDFCFCFRSDIICLQQSCPPPIHGCHEEPIQGFCCPRYECPVSMATTVNVTTTTTTTTTTLPPHFPTHSYKGAAQRRGCQIKGHTYKVGEVVRSSSGPCLHCTCGGDGQMKCDPKACTPEPMLRQMIAAAVSAKRRR